MEAKQRYLIVETTDGKRFIINETNVCSVHSIENSTASRVKMVDGSVYDLKFPIYREWEYDCLNRKD